MVGDGEYFDVGLDFVGCVVLGFFLYLFVKLDVFVFDIFVFELIFVGVVFEKYCVGFGVCLDLFYVGLFLRWMGFFICWVVYCEFGWFLVWLRWCC